MASSTRCMDTAFELPYELEKRLHESLLVDARKEQRTQFRPGVNRKTNVAADVVTGERSKKKIARAVTVLRDEYHVTEPLVREALCYANTWEDALRFVALQFPSDALPSTLRAKPDSTGEDRKADDENGALLAVVAPAGVVEEKEDQPLEEISERIKAAAVPVDNWDDEEEEATRAHVVDLAAAVDPAPKGKEEGKQDEHEAMSWTQQYLLQLAAEEEREKELQRQEAALTPEERELRDLESQFTALNDRMREQKASGKLTKKKQKALTQDIQMLRMQLVRLGWREAEYRKKQQELIGGNDDIKEQAMKTSSTVSPAATDNDRLFYERDGRQSRLGFREDEDEDVASTVKTSISREVVLDDNEDDEDYSGGLFDQLSASTTVAQPPPVSNIPETSSPATLRTGGSILADFAPTLGSWTGKTPRDLLQDYCQKQKMGRPQYKKLSTRGSHLYSIALEKKGLPRQEFTANDELFTTKNGFRTIDEAKDAVATVTLYALTPNLPLYGMMPPPFRALWLEWERAKQAETTASRDAETQAFDSFVEEIFQCLPEEIQSKIPTVSEPTQVMTQEAPKVDEPQQTAIEQPTLDSWDVDDWDADLSDNETAVVNEPSTKTTLSTVQEDSPEDIEKRGRVSRELHDLFLRNTRSDQYQKLLPRRNELPIANFREEIISALDKHNVILISGETGCGKSTQVPQYLLEEMVVSRSEGSYCQIVCTQPRRLAATSLAERVSYELGEKTMAQGDSLCGFQIRLENRMTKNTRLLFCTTGILLRKLQEASTLEEELSHIIVDEVHERDVQNDVLLSMLRTFLETKNKLRKRPLKVILMSATLNAASFQQYFGGEASCPMLSVPGRTFPVQEFYLEDAIEATQFVVDDASPSYRPPEDSGSTQSTKITISGRGGTYTQRVTWRDAQGPQGGRHQAVGGRNGDGEYSEHTLKTMDRLEESVINYELIEQLLEYLVTESDAVRLDAHSSHESASILVFLPGLQEISNLLDVLSGNRYLRDTTKFELLPLHSSLSPDDQRRIFDMRKGIIRIIATTNIAETSLTIEDVKVVIDSGRAKEMRHDSTTKTNLLEEIWISRANAKQRLGRAGRTSGGTCYRLFSRATFRHAMPEQPLPEIKRAPLTSLCLQIKTFGVEASCAAFLEGSLDPPEASSVQDALRELYEIGALELDATDSNREQLTTLGSHLAQLPVDVRVGKLLLLGAIFGQFDAISTCAAILETKSPFVAPYGYQKEMQTARQHFTVANSDLLTDTNAFNAWRQRFMESGSRSGRRQDEKAFCRQYFLSYRSLMEIVKLKKQFSGIVMQMGFLQYPPTSQPLTMASCALVASLLYAGLEPNVMYVDPALSSSYRVGLRAESDRGTTRAFIHPGSINAKVTNFVSPFVAYAVKLHTSQVFVPACSMVLPAALCVFSYSMEIVFPHRIATGSEVTVKLNDWILLQSSLRSAMILYEVRRLVRAFLEKQIQHPPFRSARTNDQKELVDASVLDALTQLFQQEYTVRDSKQLLTKQLNPPLK